MRYWTDNIGKLISSWTEEEKTGMTKKIPQFTWISWLRTAYCLNKPWYILVRLLVSVTGYSQQSSSFHQELYTAVILCKPAWRGSLNRIFVTDCQNIKYPRRATVWQSGIFSDLSSYKAHRSIPIYFNSKASALPAVRGSISRALLSFFNTVQS